MFKTCFSLRIMNTKTSWLILYAMMLPSGHKESIRVEWRISKVKKNSHTLLYIVMLSLICEFYSPINCLSIY